MRDFSAGEDGSASSSSAEKEGNLLAHSTRRQRGNFDAPGHLLSFVPEEQKSHSKSSREAAGIFSIQPSGDWQPALKLGAVARNIRRSIQLIESPLTVFLEAFDCLNWIVNCWQQRVSDRADRGRKVGSKGAGKKRGKVNQYSMVVTFRLLGFRFIPLYA